MLVPWRVPNTHKAYFVGTLLSDAAEKNCKKETTTSLRGCGCRKTTGTSCPYEILVGHCIQGQCFTNASFVYQFSHQSQESRIRKNPTVFRGNRFGQRAPFFWEVPATSSASAARPVKAPFRVVGFMGILG